METNSWMGEIPSSWQISKIGNVYSVRNEKVSDFDYSPLSVTMKGVVPQLATAAKSDDHNNRKLVKKGDFCINSRSDRRGSCGIAPCDGSVSLINTILEPRKEMIPGYYEWLFHTSQFADEFYKWGHGIVDDLWTTGWSEMKKIMIPVPPIDDQKKIADTLDTICSDIDFAIEKARTSIDDYQNLRRAIITQYVTKGIDGDTDFKDSGIEWIGQMPFSWNLAKISQIGSTSSGATPLRLREDEYFADATISWIRTLDLNDWLVYDSSEKITELALNNSSCSIMPEKTICVAMYGGGGTIGKCGMLMNPSATNQAICSVVCNDRMLPEFLLLQFLALKKYWMKYAVGTRKDPNISQEIVRQMKVVVPPIREQKMIIDFLTPKLDCFNALITEKQNLVLDLEECRRSIIYEIATGKRKN